MEAEVKAESKGIKESLEILKGLQVVVPAIVQIAADGSLSGKDIAPSIEAIKKYDIVIEAIKDAGESVKEAKDYDMAELAIIGAASLDLIKSIKSAYEAGK